MAEMKGSSAPLYLTASIPVITIGPHESTAVQLTSVMTLSDFLSGGVIAQTYTIYAETSLYPFETSAYLARQEQFEGVGDIPSFEVDLDVAQSEPRFIYPEAPRLKLLGSAPRALVTVSSATLIYGKTNLYPFETDVQVDLPLGFRNVKSLYDFETTSSILVPNGIAGRTYLYDIETRSIILIPPLLFRATTELEPFATQASITFPFQFKGIPELHPFETSASMVLGYAYSIDVDLPDFEGQLTGGMEPALTGVGDIETFESVGFFLNNSTASFFGAVDLPEFTSSGEFALAYNLAGLLNAPLPSIQGSMLNGSERLLYGVLNAPLPFIFGSLDVAPLELGGTLFAPLPSIDGFLNSPIEVTATLLAPMPFINGEMTQVFRINALMVAPLPTLRGRLKKAVAPGEAVQSNRHFNISLGIRL